MTCEPEQRHRRSIRLKEHDYAAAGAYFVTLVTEGRACLFGEVVGGDVRLNDAGRAVPEVWENLPKRFPPVQLDAFVVMPNHLHAVVIIVGALLAAPIVLPGAKGAASSAPRDGEKGAASSAPTLGDIIRAFKSLSALSVNRLLGRSGQPLWQRNYYEHIIRNEKSLNRIREYIANNPLQWEFDRENPAGARGRVPLPKDEPWRT